MPIREVISELITVIGYEFQGEGLDKAVSESKKLQKSLKDLGDKMALVGGGLNTFAYFAIDEYLDSQEKINDLAVKWGASLNDVKLAGNELFKLYGETGVEINELATGLINVYDSALPMADSLELIKVAAKGAAIDLGTLEDITNVLTTAINNYNNNNLSKSETMDLITASIKGSRLEMSDLENSLGRLLGLTNELGIELPEVMGLLAGISNFNPQASKSVSSLFDLLRFITRPNPSQLKFFEEIGVNVESVANRLKQTNLIETLTWLSRHFNEDVLTMSREGMFPNIDTLATAILLFGEKQKEVFKDANDIQQNFRGSTEDSFLILKDTDVKRWKAIGIEFTKFRRVIGEMLIKFALPLVDKVTGFFSAFNNFLKEDLTDFGKKTFGGIIWFISLATLGIGAILAYLGRMENISFENFISKLKSIWKWLHKWRRTIRKFGGRFIWIISLGATLVSRWKGFQEFWEQLWDVKSFTEGIRVFFSGIINGIKAIWEETWVLHLLLVKTIKFISTSMIAAFGSTLATIAGLIAGIFILMAYTIKNNWANIKQWFGEQLGEFGEMIANWYEVFKSGNIVEKIASLIALPFILIYQFIESVIEGLVKFVGLMLLELVGLVEKFIGLFIEKFSFSGFGTIDELKDIINKEGGFSAFFGNGGLDQSAINENRLSLLPSNVPLINPAGSGQSLSNSSLQNNANININEIKIETQSSNPEEIGRIVPGVIRDELQGVIASFDSGIER